MNQVGQIDSLVLASYDHQQPTADQIERIQLMRQAAKQFAQVIMLFVGPGPDRTHALRQVHEAMMTANKGIVCEALLNQLPEHVQKAREHLLHQNQQGVGLSGTGPGLAVGLGLR